MDKQEKELLSEEWMELVKLAMESNISQEEFKEFLAQYAAKSRKTKKELLYISVVLPVL
ncbi:anti-repressor SinI family protein [Priestia megaterium]|uniref:anti-repressor SinI family protein n=1 Tax=Priestia megaterium TaxID=1404 RepID=UPI001F49ADF8|nr:anti-repressor SinI family protein [Priestia megaterium]MED3865890.1 anti-repressor SinI family protein [Priestia megaterium]MED4098682.1 anti-repressor SinI family protein [Priestia megaterium]MED4146170.1 anti-repressor SinI family protein [Priestia megaterium]MED4170796.1 anti-repressor SinI family protein [Priestia megaterium]MED4202335.1 anti-repressor SinI family protein [Priestia megaterium]